MRTLGSGTGGASFKNRQTCSSNLEMLCCPFNIKHFSKNIRTKKEKTNKRMSTIISRQGRCDSQWVGRQQSTQKNTTAQMVLGECLQVERNGKLLLEVDEMPLAWWKCTSPLGWCRDHSGLFHRRESPLTIIVPKENHVALLKCSKP